VVEPGELLYIPALWWHAVSQKCGAVGDGSTMAINFWYDRKL
jgi:jumonji domain-containing protein 7